MRAFIALLIFYLSVNIVKGQDKHLRRRNALILPIKQCKLFWRYEDTAEGDGRMLEGEVKIDGRLRRYPIIGLSEQWLDKNILYIISGETILVSSKFEAVDNTILVQDSWGPNLQTTTYLSNNHAAEEQEEHQTNLFQRVSSGTNRRGPTTRSMGQRETVVLHIRTADSQTPFSLQKLSDVVFGTHGDVETVKSRMDACSYGQLNIVPSSKAGIQDGVFPVDLTSMVAEGTDRDVIRDAALDKLRDEYGEDLGAEFDHVMVCIPNGVKNPFIAYAWGSDFLSVYHGEWCGSLSAQVHEIGHNIGLTHSGKGTCKYCSYADQSGMMGFTYNEDNGPKMCFNAAKSWQLGWYSDRSTEVYPLKYQWDGQLVGIADYGELDDTKYRVLLKLEAPNEDIAYYVSFNRKLGVNQETKDGADQVLVISQTSKDNVPQTSYLEASLESGKRFRIYNFDKSGVTVTIKVNFIWKAGSPWYADVTVTSPNAIVDPQPTGSPSMQPTGIPSLSPSISPSLTASLSPTKLASFNPTDYPTTLKSSQPSLSNSPTNSMHPSSNPTWTMEPSASPAPVAPASMAPSTLTQTGSKGLSDNSPPPNAFKSSTGKMVLASCLSVFAAAMIVTAFYLARDKGVLNQKSRGVRSRH